MNIEVFYKKEANITICSAAVNYSITLVADSVLSAIKLQYALTEFLNAVFPHVFSYTELINPKTRIYYFSIDLSAPYEIFNRASNFLDDKFPDLEYTLNEDTEFYDEQLSESSPDAYIEPEASLPITIEKRALEDTYVDLNIGLVVTDSKVTQTPSYIEMLQELTQSEPFNPPDVIDLGTQIDLYFYNLEPFAEVQAKVDYVHKLIQKYNLSGYLEPKEPTTTESQGIKPVKSSVNIEVFKTSEPVAELTMTKEADGDTIVNVDPVEDVDENTDEDNTDGTNRNNPKDLEVPEYVNKKPDLSYMQEEKPVISAGDLEKDLNALRNKSEDAYKQALDEVRLGGIDAVTSKFFDIYIENNFQFMDAVRDTNELLQENHNHEYYRNRIITQIYPILLTNSEFQTVSQHVEELEDETPDNVTEMEEIVEE